MALNTPNNMVLRVPDKKIVIASSFEGVVNNGAKECGVVSLAAYERMVNDGRLEGLHSFAKEDPETVMKAFIFLRPMVAVAEDYLTVLMLIARNMATSTAIAKGNIRTEKYTKDAIAHFQSEFAHIKELTKDQRAEFKKEFYIERKSRQDADYRAWLGLQEPYAETLEQLRILNPLKTFDAKTGALTGGFVLYYVTSKDEASAFQLCTVYGELGIFKPGELGGTSILQPGENWADVFESMRTCLIKREHIIGKETVPDVDKVEQMRIAAEERAQVPRKQVWRLQDRYDPEEIGALKAAGFDHQFIVTGGYAFLDDYDKARAAGVPVVERSRMAQTLSDYAKEKGF